MRIIDKYISKEVSGNFFWLIFDKVIASAVAFVIYFVVARYLGPNGLGEYNYALSIVTIFATFAVLGIDGVVIRDFVNKPVKENKIFGTIFYSKLVGSIVLIIVSSVVAWVSKQDPIISFMVLVLAFGYIFRSFQVIDSWFLGKNNVKVSVIARSIAVVIVAVIKIVFIVSKLSVVYFAVATALEVIIATTILMQLFGKSNECTFSTWKFDKEYFISIAKRNWYLFAGGFFAAISLRFDQYLLGTLISEKAVGLYAPAVKFSEIWNFIPLAFLNAIYPTLIADSKNNIQRFKKKFSQTLSISFWITVIFCILIFLGSELLINILLGGQYLESIPLLRVYIWSSIGVVISSVWIKWVIIQDNSWAIFIFQVIVFVVNVLLNILLIPLYGAIGAAWATVISYIGGWVFATALTYRGWEFLKYFLGSIVMPFKIAINMFRKK